MLDIHRLLSSYYEYLNGGFEVNTITPKCHEIITPFLDRHNDNISFYVDFLGGFVVKLRDGG